MRNAFSFLAQDRVKIFITTFLLTLLIYVLRGIGLFTIVPGWVFLLLFAVTYLIFFIAVHPQRQIW